MVADMEVKHGNFHRIHMREAYRNESRLVNQKSNRLKKGEHRDGIKRKGDKMGMVVS